MVRAATFGSALASYVLFLKKSGLLGRLRGKPQTTVMHIRDLISYQRYNFKFVVRPDDQAEVAMRNDDRSSLHFYIHGARDGPLPFA